MNQPIPNKHSARHREVFVLAIRIIGVTQITSGIYYLVSLVNILTDHFRPHTVSPGAYGLQAIAAFMVAAYFLRGAPSLVEFAYRPRTPTVAELADEETSSNGVE